MGKFQSTKTFSNYSVALRQWRAQHSHCQLLHGYALKFKVWFEANDTAINDGLDEMNWIVDYGGFKDSPVGNGLKKWMNDMWDHTLLIEKDDPQLETFQLLEEMNLAKLVILDKMGAESCAKLVFEHFNDRLALTDGGRCKVTKVECWENETNSSTYGD
jgi:6-pyruvoyltetrahydropterin/6-carboxytetrahydropterin synthase